jgi:peptidoglycan/LPS O-acetylase OafA/YrhL
MASTERVFGLDLLRAAAILFVVYAHGMHFLPPDFPHDVLALPILDGVTIFFVLSGFLIGRILLKTINHEEFSGRMLLNFWIRRWFRTLPNYYLVLVLIIVTAIVTGDQKPPIPDNLYAYFFFTQNIAWPHPEFFGEAWSLVIEEWFYLLTPIPLLLFTRLDRARQQRLLVAYIFLVIVVTTLFRLYRAHTLGLTDYTEWEYTIKMQVITRMDSLMLGVLGAYASLYQKDLWAKAGASWIFASGIMLLLLDRFLRLDHGNLVYLNYFALTLTPIATLMLLPKLSAWHVKTGIAGNAVTFISVISYSMYLTNQALIGETIIPAIMPGLMHHLWRFSEHVHSIQYALYWFLTIGVSAILYRYYEKPMMVLRDRFSFGHRTPAHAFKHPT